MRFFFKSKDGGPESSVTGYWLIEWKRVFSICLLKFEGKSREAFHSHAFNSIAWVLIGKLIETRMLNGSSKYYLTKIYSACFKPFFILRSHVHKVDSEGTTWVLNIRGPWSDTWKEVRPLEDNREVTLTHGRQEI